MGRYLSAVIVTILWMTFEQEGHCSQAAVHTGRLLVTYTGQHRAGHTAGPLQVLCHSSVWHDGRFLMNVGREHQKHTVLEQMSVCVLRAALRLGGCRQVGHALSPSPRLPALCPALGRMAQASQRLALSSWASQSGD